MIAVADTHTVIWYLYGDPRLSQRARHTIEDAALHNQQIAISGITLVEMVYLIEKGRIAAESLSWLTQSMAQSDAVFIEVPVTLAIARALSAVAPSQIPDMPDRIIAATGYHLGLPVISRDGKISASTIQSIW